jgi:hypothetical protein
MLEACRSISVWFADGAPFCFRRDRYPTAAMRLPSKFMRLTEDARRCRLRAAAGRARETAYDWPIFSDGARQGGKEKDICAIRRPETASGQGLPSWPWRWRR